MGNVDRVGVLQHSELVSRVTKMLNPTDLVLPVVHETLVRRGKMWWPLHHHVGLLPVALETGNEIELTRLWSIPLWSEIVLYSRRRVTKKHERSLSFWTRYSSLRPSRIVILGLFEANEEWLCILQSRIKNIRLIHWLHHSVCLHECPAGIRIKAQPLSEFCGHECKQTDVTLCINRIYPTRSCVL